MLYARLQCLTLTETYFFKDLCKKDGHLIMPEVEECADWRHCIGRRELSLQIMGLVWFSQAYAYDKCFQEVQFVTKFAFTNMHIMRCMFWAATLKSYTYETLARYLIYVPGYICIYCPLPNQPKHIYSTRSAFRGGTVSVLKLWSHDCVIKWKHFRVTDPLWGESTGHRGILL